MAFSKGQEMMQISYVAVVILLCPGLIILCAAQPLTVTVNGSTPAGTFFRLPTTLKTQCFNPNITSTFTNRTLFKWNDTSLVLEHQLTPEDFPKVKCRHEVPSTMKVFISCEQNPSLEVDLYYQNSFDNHTSRLCNLDCQTIDPTIYVFEDTAVGTPILNFTICDEDIVISGQDNIKITSDYLVDKDNSQFILKKELDFEANESLTINFSVNNAAQQITIKVNDSDDQGIQFTSFIYACQMKENQSSTTSGNCAVQAKDLDKGIKAEITYQLEAVTPGNLTIFGISKNGSVQANFLDREMYPQYQLFIKGYQTNRPNDRVSYTSMVINVTDVDDNPPVMSQDLYNMSVMENSPNGTIVSYVSATDADQGENAGFIFIIRENDFFEVNKKTGAVIVKGTLDREQTPTINLTVSAHSTSGKYNSTQSNITVTIIDENDNSPNITNYTSAEIRKTRSVGSILQMTANDKDEGDNSKLSFLLNPASDTFEIYQNGSIYLKKSLNDTQTLQYQLYVIVHDMPNPEYMRRFSSSVVTVTVEDENTHSPEFESFINKTHVLEDANPGTILLLFTATDKDPTDNLTFSILDDHSGTFRIDDNRLILNKSLDREERSNYSLTIQVEDGKHNDTKQTRVIVDDVNDNDPIFVNQTYHFTTLEEQLGTLGNVKANDADFNQSITYTLEQETLWRDYIKIVKENGTVYLSKPIDRESITLPISLLVFATDNGKPTRSGNATMTIEVVDINDNAPTFDTEIKTFSFPEYTQPSFVYNATAYDKDSELHNYNKVLYRLKDGNGKGLNKYISVSEDGTVKFTQQLNLSTINKTFQSTFILFEIEAYNNENYTILSNQSIENGTQQVNLTITDINEKPYFKTFVNKMVFPEGISHPSCPPCMKAPENFTFLVLDPDFEDKYTETKFKIKGGKRKFEIQQNKQTDGIYFHIHQIEKIDYEIPNETFFNLTITATNTFPLEDGTESSVSISLFVNITDSDDNFPKFAKDSIECRVEENYTGTVPDCPVNAEDMDKVYKTDFNYIIPKMNDSFEVTKNGLLKLTQPLDYEQQKEIHLTVYANFSRPPVHIDGCLGQTCNTSIAVTINVININDETPQFNDTSYRFDVTESNLTDILIGNLTAYDKDSAKVHISIADNENFTVIQNGFSAHLLTKKPIDYETSQEFIIKATVFDGKFSSYANISINVVPVNEYPPVFNQSSYKWILSQNSTRTGTFKFYVTDMDKHQPKNFSYRIVGGNGLGLFDIYGKELHVVKSLTNFGGQNVTLTIESNDNDSPPLTGVTTIDIVIESVNLYPPSFLGPVHATVMESDNETEVLKVFAFDKDTSQDRLAFNVTGNEKFFFKNTTGPPWTSTLYAKSLDAEQDCDKNGTCEILIHVSDGVHEENATIFVKIEDTNDNSPCFNETAYSKSIEANFSTGTDVLGVSADDSDISNKGFTFILYDTSGDFKINRSTGIVSLARPLGKNGKQYSMQVEVLDHGSPPSSNMTTITFTINYASLHWKLLNCSKEVPENDNAIDLQLSTYININSTAGFTYQIISDDKFEILKTFSLNSSTGELKLANKSNALDFEKQSVYRFELQVNDSGIFPQIQNCNFTINVTDINEGPKITMFEKTTYQEENTSNGTFVFHIEATDPDVNPTFKNLTFSLSDNTFTVDKNGNITVNVPQLQAGSYSVNITVTDGGNMKASDSILIIVPKINVNYTSNNLPENGTVPTTVLDLSSKGIKYTILPSPYMGKFNITEHDTLVLIDPLDREVTDSVSLRIHGSYMTNNILLHDITVNITVIDVNDCSPKFVFHNLTIFIDDITIPGTIIGYMPATDDDVDDTNRNLTYSIEKHEHFTAKSITDLFSATNDGAVTVKSPVMPVDYQLILRVTDGDFNDTVNITVSVRNTNDHSPVFTYKTYSFTITETNTSITIGKVIATDEDGDNIYYNFSTAIDIFQIDQNGTISTKVPIDREAKALYTLYVQATDNETNPREDICIVTIIVADVNDNYPQFEASKYSGTIMENSRTNTTIQILPPIIATDKDNAENGTKGIHFSLNENTQFCIDTKIDQDVALGSVYVCKTPIDRETTDEYNLTLYASDGKGLNTSATLTIHVLDENDETPLFDEADYLFNVTENVHVTYSIGNVSVTDNDLNGTQTVRFGLQNGGEGKFYMSPISGHIYATGSIDREENGSYSLNVSAYDGIHTNYKEVLIHVIDVNDNAPDFILPNWRAGEVFVVQVTEDSPPGSIFNFSASDKDLDQTITFSFNGTKPFNLTKDGQLILESALDRETHEHYFFVIIASDNGTPFSLSSILTVKIVVLDINDNSPKFFVDNVFANETKCSTIEKAPLMSVLKLFRTVDNDFGINGTVNYTIEPSDVANYFNVEQQEKTGILLIKRSLVVNTLVSLHKHGNNDTVELNLTIVATDGGGLKSTFLIQVRVEPLNDEDIPVFTAPTYSIEVYENVTTGSVVGGVTATIPNATVSHLHYTWIGHVAAFKVSDTLGNITTFQQLDRESRSSYTLAVQVRDGRIPERTAFAAVEIKVLDVNDNSPEFKYNYMDYLFIPENTTINKNLSFAAFDRDSGQNAEITYYLQEENNDSRFWIDNSTGILTINGIFDYENKHTYSLQIVAADNGSPKMSNSTNITVQITDENDNAPIFKTDSCKMFNIYENILHSEPICRVEASDLDSGLNGKIIYGIFDSFAGPFNVHPFNGSIYLEGMLDYEAQSSYSLVILAQDQGNSSLTATLTVNVAVQDVYDDVPKFDKQVFETTVSSSAAVNTTVIDLDINIPQPNFTIQGNDAVYFKIDPASGNISVAKKLDSKREIYAFTVVVYAGQNASYNASAVVLVRLTGRDITFDKSEIVISLAENLKGNQIVYDLNTTEESGPTGAAYSIISVDPESGNHIFNIDESTGIVTCNHTLDREVAKTYVILIAAQSRHAREKRDISVPSTTFRLVINVTDENDNSPYFPEDHQYIFGVPDDARAYYLVTTVKAKDPDDFDQLRYDILGERYGFNIDARTGDLRTTTAIASASQKEFNMTILVDDGGGISHNATLDIIIHVVPTRNQPILFINKTVNDLVKLKDIIERNMSDILGVTVQIEKILSHKFISEDKVFRVDMFSSDLYFHGINKTTNTIISNEEMKKLLEANTEPLARLFGSKAGVEYAVISPLIADPSAVNASQILMICMAVFILIGTSALLGWSQYSWTKYEKEQIQNLRERMEREHNDLELNSIRSRQSSKLSSLLAAAAANPGFEETEFLSNGELYPGMKNEPQYESQELRMTFGDEPIEAHIPAENLQDFVQSVVDSGVGNTSVHSGQNRESCSQSVIADEEDRQSKLQLPENRSIDDEGPVMTSSPRLHRDAQQSPSTSAGISFLDVNRETNAEVTDNTSDRSPTTEVRKTAGSVVLLDATGETETDDELDESEENKDEDIPNTATVTESASRNQATDVIVFKEGEPEHEHEAAVESTAF